MAFFLTKEVRWYLLPLLLFLFGGLFFSLLLQTFLLFLLLLQPFFFGLLSGLLGLLSGLLGLKIGLTGGLGKQRLKLHPKWCWSRGQRPRLVSGRTQVRYNATNIRNNKRIWRHDHRKLLNKITN